jgi:hypothetical protein
MTDELLDDYFQIFVKWYYWFYIEHVCLLLG